MLYKCYKDRKTEPQEKLYTEKFIEPPNKFLNEFTNNHIQNQDNYFQPTVDDLFSTGSVNPQPIPEGIEFNSQNFPSVTDQVITDFSFKDENGDN